MHRQADAAHVLHGRKHLEASIQQQAFAGKHLLNVALCALECSPTGMPAGGASDTANRSSACRSTSGRLMTLWSCERGRRQIQKIAMVVVMAAEAWGAESRDSMFAEDCISVPTGASICRQEESETANLDQHLVVEDVEHGIHDLKVFDLPRTETQWYVDKSAALGRSSPISGCQASQGSRGRAQIASTGAVKGKLRAHPRVAVARGWIQ